MRRRPVCCYTVPTAWGCLIFSMVSGCLVLIPGNTGTPGNVALLSQSGAGMSGIVDCEERLGFCFAASTGQELCISLEDYLDYVLDLPETKVVGLFLETSRHPRRFIEALDKARQKQIPIVALKVGKTELSAQLAVSHSGALAGSDATYQAVFDRYGVQRVDDMAELATALMMFSHSPPVAEGGVVSLHDSGGERQLAIDLADALNVPMTHLSTDTVKTLEAVLDEGLPAVNPLDAWGVGGEGAPQAMADCFAALLSDPGAALGAVIHDRAPGGGIYSSYLEYCKAGREATGKPVFLVANHQGSGTDPAAVEASHAGIAVIDGLRQFLAGARCLLAYRDFLARPAPVESAIPGKAIDSQWQVLLESGRQLNEWQAGSLLRELGIPVLASEPAASAEELAALSIEFPVVLKTMAEGVAHKTEAGGVCLGLETAQTLQQAYLEMSARLGPQVLVAPMIKQEGVEMLLGVTRDSQFGPVVVVGFGGVHAEIYRDVITLLPPFTEACVRRALSGLKLAALLGEVRGRPALAIDEFCKVVVRVGEAALQLSQWVQEIDMNPLLLTPQACIGLDVLMAPVPTRGEDGDTEY